jgi:asparagine synthase (glutamine-hydrolysing)
VCGLAGWLGVVPAEVVAERVLGALRHRGPDGRAERRFAEGCLLHTRLRILDLSATGDQPMANEDGSVWVVFNGEIYNHRLLRSELEARGHVFRGSSDSEVLPHLYEEHGVEMFSRLRGMFAVAVLDRRRRRLVLARDRFGIKPLFYAAGEQFVAFASELNALKLVPGIDLTPDPQAIADFAAVLFVPAPLTIHRGVRALCPGELLDCRLEGDGRARVERRRFHSFAVAPDPDLTLAEAVERAEGLVEEGVARQLESDVPLGALLSGGIDSSLVSAFAQKRSGGDLLTFNVRFPDREYDETWAAQAVAAAIGSQHQTLEMNGAGGSWEHVTRLLRQAGQPFADTSLFAVDAVSQAMREHVTVALSGDGGDEGFGGYDVYWRIARAARLQRLPLSFWRAGILIAQPLSRAHFGPPTLERSLRGLAGADDTGVVQELFSWLSAYEQRELLVDGDGVEPARRLFERQWQHTLPAGSSRLERLMAHAVEVNIRLILANDFLPKVDTASMRHSLEVRVPMLDEDVIDYGLTLPHTLRVRGRTGKPVLRNVAARHLPQTVVEKPKQGFAIPVDRWVDAPFRRNLREALLDRDSHIADVFNKNVYAPWVDAFCNNQPHPRFDRGGLYQRLIMLLALELSLDGVRAAQ